MSSKNFLILVLIAFLALFFIGWTSEAEHQEEFQKVLPLSSQGTFNLKNVNGKMSISTWKEAKVEIKALKKTNKAAENLQKVKIEVTAAADSVSVDTVYPKMGNTGVSIDYDVKVPEGVNLGQLGNVNGNIGVTGPFGRVSAQTTNGGLHLENATGNVKLKTTNGDIAAVNVSGTIEAHTTNGSISLELTKLESGISAKTTNGSVSLRLSAAHEINAVLEAKTVNGSISFDVPVTLQSLDKSHHHLRGQLGQGGPQLSLETVNGSIRLTR